MSCERLGAWRSCTSTRSLAPSPGAQFTRGATWKLRQRAAAAAGRSPGSTRLPQPQRGPPRRAAAPGCLPGRSQVRCRAARRKISQGPHAAGGKPAMGFTGWRPLFTPCFAPPAPTRHGEGQAQKADARAAAAAAGQGQLKRRAPPPPPPLLLPAALPGGACRPALQGLRGSRRCCRSRLSLRCGGGGRRPCPRPPPPPPASAPTRQGFRLYVKENQWSTAVEGAPHGKEREHRVTAELAEAWQALPAEERAEYAVRRAAVCGLARVLGRPGRPALALQGYRLGAGPRLDANLPGPCSPCAAGAR